MRVGILGGGLSGVTLQHFLRHDSEILEKEDRCGGLCRTFEVEGFQYDIGGHVLYSKHEALMDVIRQALRDNINLCRRNNKILYKGRLVKYPFENGLSALDKEEIFECLIGYLQNNHPEPANFLEWIYYTFGDGLAEKYLVPYNTKIWKTDLADMSLEWVKRVPRPPLEDLVRSALGIETEGYVHQLHFLYPKHGGIEGLIQAFGRGTLVAATNFEVRRISRSGAEWIVSDGTEAKYFDRLVLTLPVKEAVRYLDNVPDRVAQAINGLRHNSVRVVLVGVNNESLLDKSAIYLPSSDVIAHRVCYMGFFSRHTVPPGRSSLIAEVTTNSRDAYCRASDSSLTETIVDGLEKMGIIGKNDVTVTDVTNIEYGYVVYDHAYQEEIKIARDYFASLGIELLGRFAEFEYINMDEVIRRSVNLAGRLNSVGRDA